MTRYIDADALLEELEKSCKWHAENSRELSLLRRDINIVEEQPTIDAEPGRHAKLLNAHPYGECSNCGYLIDIREEFNYCPNCGARMDEDERD